MASSVARRPACALCLQSSDEPLVVDGSTAFCPTCLAAIGRFATSGSSRTRFWPALEGVTHDEPPDLDSPGFQEVVDELVEHDPEMFGELPRILQMRPQLPPADAETHLDLSVAYREMGLPGLALREAAAALQSVSQLPRRRALTALRFLLDRRQLQFPVDELLIVVRETIAVS